MNLLILSHLIFMCHESDEFGIRRTSNLILYTFHEIMMIFCMIKLR